MSHTSSDIDNKMNLKEQIESPPTDEGSSWGSFTGGGALKKGPWTSAEDAMLIEYVKKHGEGNWNAVQKHSGLSRCGKSCRLRWANHLRPNLKKGAFTGEEEQLIIELHAKMGNKWARMAAHLPGRTDNEIKNYWNTRIKRRQRAGLPLYPPNMCLQSLDENQQNQGDGDFVADDRQNDEVLQPNSYEIPDIIFDNLKANRGILSYMSPFPDKPVSSMLNQGLGPQNCGFLIPTTKGMKRPRESETSFPSSHSGGTFGLPVFEQFSHDSPGKVNPHYPFGMGFPYDPDPGCKSLALSVGTLPGSHALLNGNFSASHSLPGSAKLELPSLQYPETDLNSFLVRPLTPIEAASDYVESPPTMVSVQSDCVSPRNSGLLEALLHESRAMGITKNQPSEKSSNSSTGMASDLVDGSTFKPCNMDWEEYNDPISPLGHSATSVFSTCTPPTSGSSLGESSPGKTPAATNIKSETVECDSTQNAEETNFDLRLVSSGPDALFLSDWCSDGSKDHTILTDAIATILGEDFYSEYKHVPPETSSAVRQGLAGLSAFPWSEMPPTFQLSESP